MNRIHAALVRRLVAALALVACASPASAEPGRVDVEVRVADAGGSPAALQLTPLGSVAAQRRLTLEPGTRWVVSVSPGRWEMQVGDAAPLALLLEAGESVVLEVELAGDAPRVRVARRERAGVGTAMGAERLHELPSSRNLWGLLETFEPIAIADRQDGVGLFAGEPGRVMAHGSSWSQTSFQVDGLGVTDPDRTGTPLVQPPWEGLDSLHFQTALLPVETGGPGPLLSITPRRPTARWSGGAVGMTAPSGLQAENARPADPSIARLDSWWEGGVSLAGPLVEDRVALRLSGNLTRSRRFERDDPEVVEGSVSGALAQLVVTPQRGGELRVLLGRQQAERPYPGRARYEGSPAQREGFSQAQARWESGGASGWSLAGGWWRGRLEPELAGFAPRSVERLVDGPIPELASAGDSTRQRFELSAGLRPDLRGFDGGRHALRLGASFARNRSETGAASASPPIAELVDGRAARVWDYGYAGTARWSSTELALWGADRIRLGNRLSVEVGIRLERISGSAEAAPVGVTWTSLSPRLRFRQDLLGGGRVVFFGGYARYRHRLPLSVLAFGDAAAAQGEVRRWADVNGDRVFQADERGVLVSRAGPGGDAGAIDPDLQRPHTDEFVLGLEGRVTDDFQVRFTAIARRERDLLESVNVGVDASRYRVVRVVDPSGDFDNPEDDQLLAVFDRDPASFGRDSFLLTNPGADHASRHEGVEILFDKRWGEAARLMIGATAHRSEGSAANVGFGPLENDQGLIGELFDHPNADSFARGRLFSDRAYSINIALETRLPGDLRASSVARYQDGQPFARLVVADGLSQGPELVRAVPNGRHRFTFAITVDLRLEKGFRLGRARVAAVGEVFNLLNNSNDVAEDPIARPQFRIPVALQPPRAARLGLRVDF